MWSVPLHRSCTVWTYRLRSRAQVLFLLLLGPGVYLTTVGPATRTAARIYTCKCPSVPCLPVLAPGRPLRPGRSVFIPLGCVHLAWMSSLNTIPQASTPSPSSLPWPPEKGLERWVGMTGRAFGWLGHGHGTICGSEGLHPHPLQSRSEV